jgi:peptidoglycan-N-acetylglucosamine deacetylase
MKKIKGKWFIVVFIIIVFFTLCGYLLFQISNSRTFQFFGGLTSRVNTDKKVIALTFDDAPSPRVNDVLNVLNEKQVKATFYLIGQNIEKYPVEAKKIVDAGMEVGNHSYSHQRFLLKPLSFIDSEVQRTNTSIRNTGYHGEITFRPPNGKKLFGLPWYLHQHTMKTIMWDVEPDSFAREKPEAITRYTLDHVRPGSIILIHPFCEKECVADREALPHIIDALQLQGYTFVTISQLLKY